MAQKLSGSIKTQEARDSAQGQDALDRRFPRVRSQEEGTAVSLANGVGNSQSNSSEASPEAFHVKQEVERQNAPATLPGLPTELILAVALYLPPSGYMSLSYSCRTIRNKMGASIDHVIGDKVPTGRHSGTTISIETRNIRYLERMDLQCMLDHDRKMSPSKSPSLDYSPFEVPALPKLRMELRCLGNAGLLWICPHRQYDYKEVTRSSVFWEGHRCEGSPLFTAGRIGNDYVFSIPIMRVPRDHVPSYEEVREALRPLEAPVCPHLRLNDVTFWHTNCRWSRACDFCGTVIYTQEISTYNGLTTLHVFMVRSIKEMRDCTDRAWVAQVAQPADFEEYERAWQATHVECLRRVGSLSPI